ncbi:MAG: Crp/Fnr family transcriptional regulator [Parvibaculum sp.]|uniref:Crp/Fnr family transcriptional regulator n=1 Tax=Parvibaculum sp. TaxID=2024848 RepID=UPI0032EDF671
MRLVPDRKRIAETFSRNGWFSRCPARLREALVAHAQVSAVEAGRWIYDTGDEAHGLYGVLSGSVTSHVVLDNGEAVPISISGPGTVFGYAAQVLGGKRVTTAIARERAETIFIPQHALAAIVRDMPALWLHFAELATEQLVWAARAYAERMRLSPEAQIASRLYLYSFPWGGGGPATLPIRQDELAELTGFSRKTINLALRDFAARGLVKTGYRSISVLDPGGLHKVAMAAAQ